eukprot:TRINITY_DN326_c0_g1_i1.p1 TRINITY_DN326_c0_g1~~TRINITY_DN326_c0_g1_i1.p1  ORF type:complete len:154 (-),score=16.60 TRINITY_DN326_c0_g1_i1:176-637(-)
MCDSHFSPFQSWLLRAELDSHIETTEDLINGWETQIEKTNKVKRAQGKPETDVKFFEIKRRTRYSLKIATQIPLIKSLYCFKKSRNDSFLLVKLYSKDSCVRKLNFEEVTSKVRRKNTNCPKKAPHFPKHSARFTDSQMNLQEKGIEFRKKRF